MKRATLLPRCRATMTPHRGDKRLRCELADGHLPPTGRALPQHRGRTASGLVYVWTAIPKKTPGHELRGHACVSAKTYRLLQKAADVDGADLRTLLDACFADGILLRLGR